jgi:hypothetical protein
MENLFMIFQQDQKLKVAYIVTATIQNSWTISRSLHKQFPIGSLDKQVPIGGFKNLDELQRVILENKLEFHQVIILPDMKCFDLELSKKHDVFNAVRMFIRNKHGDTYFHYWAFSEDGKNLIRSSSCDRGG